MNLERHQPVFSCSHSVSSFTSSSVFGPATAQRPAMCRVQATSSSAALMYHVIGALVQPTGATCLLDLYSGIGTIGLTLARRCKSVVCVDNAPQNDADGRANAAELGVTNCKFVRGAAEASIREVLTCDEVTHAPELVAVINPPRGGVPHDFALTPGSTL